MNASLLPVARPLLALRRSRHAATACGAGADGPRQGPRRRRGLAVSRRGSILIFVVALLVLLAVIGTAYLSTTRTDRYATQQNSYNTEVDLLVDGVQNAVEAQLLGGLFRDGKFRPAGDPNYRDQTGFDFSQLSNPAAVPPVDVPGGEALLASRIPTLYNPNGTSVNSYPMWSAISAPVLDNAFESPIPPTAAPNFPRYDVRLRMQPGSVLVNGQQTPALAAPVGKIANNPLFVAADTDGDGIADAGLVRIPVGRIAGLTYYCAVRVIDNGSAINVNTAGSRSMDFLGNGTGVEISPLYKAHVGLAEMLQTFNSGPVETAVSMRTPGMPANFSGINHDALSTEYLKLDVWRTGLAQGATSARVAGLLGSPLGTMPIRDSAMADPDFNFLTMGDAFRAQLARRTDNPGLNTATLPYRAYSLGDTMALIYPFGLTGGTTGTSQLEKDLDLSLKRAATPSSAGPDRGAFAADETNLWFDASFNFNAEVHGKNVQPLTFRPIRTLLTANNGVSNLTPARYDNAGTRAVPVQITTAFTNSGVTDLMNYFGSGASAARVSANTADVLKLWWGYWQAMSDFNTLDGRFDSPFWRQERLFTNAGGKLEDPYLGGRFVDPGPQPAGGTFTFPPAPPRTGTQKPMPITPQTAEYHPDRMFRSPLRVINPVPGTEITTLQPRILPKGMALIRSAIAAANAVDWRDVNYDVTPYDFNSANPYRPLTINLTAGNNEVAGPLPSLNVTVYGQEPQPFITEVYAQTDTVTKDPAIQVTTNPNGYIAVELHNPYSFAIDVRNCRIGLIDRKTASTPFNLTLQDASTGATPINLLNATSNLDTVAYMPPTVIPAGGYLVLENYDATKPASGASGDATYRPGSLNLKNGFVAAPTTAGLKPILTAVSGAKVNFAFVANLHAALDHDLVLLRPLGYDRVMPVAGAKRLELPQVAINGAMVDVLRYSQPNNNLVAATIADLVPLDSYDFTNISTAITSVWHYVRANDAANPWRFVYPGRYDGDQATGRPHQQGTQQAMPWVPDASGIPDPSQASTTDPWDTTLTGTPGIQPTPAVNVGSADAQASFPTSFTIQLADPGRFPFGTTNSTNTVNPVYPFGGFARDGDLLQVPFIGAYTVRVPGAAVTANDAQIVEMNPVTMDAAFAEDTDTNDDPAIDSPPGPDDLYKEQVGRFSPLARFSNGGVIPDEGTNLVLYDDLYVPTAGYPDEPMLGYPNDALGLSRLRYAWARDLFDFLQVAAPQEDFLPDITASKAIDLKIATPEAVANTVGSANGTAERTYPEQGRVNINTAPLKVLDAIPFVPTGTDESKFVYDPGTGKLTVTVGADMVPDNLQIARAIVNFRDGNAEFGIPPAGPFRSLFDLYRLDAVRLAQENAFRLRGNGTTSDPGPTVGDYTPPPTTPAVTGEIPPDGVRYDFEERNLMLTRISNLVTLRSDTFTVYLVVQGWSKAGTAGATKEVERRRVFVLDRSRVGPDGQGAILYPVPTR